LTLRQNETKRGPGRVLGVLASISIVAGFYLAFQAPPDAYQGDVQRIMYLHIPSIMAAYVCYFIVFVGSCLYLWKREKRDDILAKSAAEVAVLFTALTIIEGSIWGKPTWGVWWTWDARLTFTAILLMIFVGYMMLRSLIEDEERAAVAGAVVAIIGALDIPLIHMSVYWWRTLHQPPSIMRPDKLPWETVKWPLLLPVIVNIAALVLLALYLLSLRFRLGETEERIKREMMEGAA
jgi:heme exporter protein C